MIDNFLTDHSKKEIPWVKSPVCIEPKKNRISHVVVSCGNLENLAKSKQETPTLLHREWEQDLQEHPPSDDIWILPHNIFEPAFKSSYAE